MAATAEAKRHAAKIARRLAEHYPEATCSLDFQSPLELLVATILSAQCTDVRVNQVTKSLFRKYPTAAHYARAKLPELERDIQSTGFFRNKAKSIQNCCRALLERYDGEVPKDIDQLVELPGIGRKTANVVLGTAYRHRGRGGRRHARRPDQPPAGADQRKGPGEDRTGPDGTVCREGVDRLEPSDDPARPPLLHGPEPQVRRVSAWNRFVRESELKSKDEILMVLSGHEIKRQLGSNIVIDPFDESRLNPNSYNLTLHDELMVYEEVVLDMRKANRVRRMSIPHEGWCSNPTSSIWAGRSSGPKRTISCR